jgi:2-polyprenyl-3-methyl-5-hydroxy-6-metoxy-1,4-benzoquinol methylase
MKNADAHLSDAAWEEWGRRDPYYAVLTDPKYRRSAMDEAARREFFASGEGYVQHVFTAIRIHIDTQFEPRRVLDFGCGVGRLLPAFAAAAEEVVGVDVSPSMLAEARRNCDERGLKNVQLLLSDDQLSAVGGGFDLIHSSLVLQHLPIERGRAIFGRLLGLARPGGAGAVQITYSKTRFAATHGVAPPEPVTLPLAAGEGVTPPPAVASADPEIQMNPYNLNQMLFLLQCQGVRTLFAEFEDHGGELALSMFFAVNGPPLGAATPEVEPTNPA